MKPTNPAARIRTCLVAISKRADKRVVRQTLAEVFETDANDTGEILRSTGILLDQVRVATELVAGVEGATHDLYIRPLKEVLRAFSTFNLEESTTIFAGRLGPATISSLEYTADFLDREYPVSVLPDDQREPLIGKVETLLGEIRAADIELEFKRVLLEHAERLRRALIEYRLRGAEAIIGALDLNLGFAIRSVATTSDERKLGVLARVNLTLIEAYTVVSSATKLYELGVKLKGWLQLGSGEAPGQ